MINIMNIIILYLIETIIILFIKQSIRTGVFDVLPEGSLDSLTAEDLRLLLNGVGDINVAVLISYTSFNDESGENSERLVKFKRWLWSIVEKMTHLERQDLVIFIQNVF